MNKNDYFSNFNNIYKRNLALERAWKNRDFEIDLYWKRATYFWAFNAGAFAGYFLLSSKGGSISKLYHPEFIIICLGFIFSLAWYLVNKGSKKWVENWENHIDQLEDDITGPIHKTVYSRRSYSVTRINLKVSLFVTFIWIALGVFYSIENLSWGKICNYELDRNYIGMLVITLIFSISLIFGSKTKFKDKNISFILRKTHWDK